MRITAATLTAGVLFLLTAGCSKSKPLIGVWHEPEGTTIEFLDSSKLVVHPKQPKQSGSPPVPLSIACDYKIIDKSHLKIMVPKENPVVAEFVVTGDTMKMTTADDGEMVYTKVHR